MTYAKIHDGAVVRYPYTRADLQADNPHTSFPVELAAEVLADFGVVPVQPTAAPSYDPLTQSAAEDVPALVGGQWQQQWVIRAATPAEVIERSAASRSTLVEAVQGHLDATARARNYDGILSLASYAASNNPPFAAEGRAGADWRDAVWLHCYGVLDDVTNGLRPVPSVDALIAELPEMVWPPAA